MKTKRLTLKLRNAAQSYLALQRREVHPRGRTDNGGRWWPSKSERRGCCARLRGPSRAHPWALMLHCRTMVHVAAAHGYTVAEIRWAVSRLKAEIAHISFACPGNCGNRISSRDFEMGYQCGDCTQHCVERGIDPIVNANVNHDEVARLDRLHRILDGKRIAYDATPYDIDDLKTSIPDAESETVFVGDDGDVVPNL